jgi:hypothetical protein
MNDEGNPVKLSSQPGHQTTYYCGQRRSIPGSDGCCGPNNGPQCTSCKNFQRTMATPSSAERGRVMNDEGNAGTGMRVERDP